METSQIITNEKIKKLQNTELDILEAIDRVCKTNDIEYYLACGTLLGSIRHKGFIPWDDDVDILMTRSNYNKLMSLPESAFPKNIHLRSFYNTDETDPNISFQTKIEAVDRKVLRKVGDKIVEQKIWVDVFVIDGMPKSKIAREMHYWNIQLHQTFFRIARSAKNGELKDKKRGKLEKAGIFILHVIPVGKLLSIKKMMERTERVFARYPLDHSDLVIAFVPLYRKKGIVKRKIFEGNRTGRFSGEDFPIPAGAEDLLTSWYGDYMQLPPVEKRVASHCEDVVES